MASVGLAVHLVLPQIPGIKRSLGLLADASPPLVVLAFALEAASEACYAELLGRSVGMTAGNGASLKRRRRYGIGPWFAFKLTVTGYGAAHVLPGGGATAATVSFGAFKRRGLDPRRVGVALAAVTALVYGALGVLFSGSLVYLAADRDLGLAATVAVVCGLLLGVGFFALSLAAYRNPRATRRVLRRLAARLAGRLPGRYGRRLEERVGGVVVRLRKEIRAVYGQYRRDPVEVLGLVGLAFGYWVFDALCLVATFGALGVRAGFVELLVAYGVATVVGSLPLTPGGIGVFEAAMLAVLSLLGVGSEAVVPILGYRLFNFWLPIPLAVLFYPTLRFGGPSGVRVR